MYRRPTNVLMITRMDAHRVKELRVHFDRGFSCGGRTNSQEGRGSSVPLCLTPFALLHLAFSASWLSLLLAFLVAWVLGCLIWSVPVNKFIDVYLTPIARRKYDVHHKGVASGMS